MTISARKCFCKKCSQKFRKTDRKKPVSDSDTKVFLSILQNFQEHLFYWTPPVAASSSFKASGFTEAVMQMNFWISHDLFHPKTLSSTWHFCVYFRQAQTFRCISMASFLFSTALWCGSFSVKTLKKALVPSW